MTLDSNLTHRSGTALTEAHCVGWYPAGMSRPIRSAILGLVTFVGVTLGVIGVAVGRVHWWCPPNPCGQLLCLFNPPESCDPVPITLAVALVLGIAAGVLVFLRSVRQYW